MGWYFQRGWFFVEEKSDEPFGGVDQSPENLERLFQKAITDITAMIQHLQRLVQEQKPIRVWTPATGWYNQ